MRLSERVSADLAARTRFADIRILGKVDSTNRYVRDAAQAGAPEGLVVTAEHQAAGRGRLGRTWEAPPGTGLLMSVLLRPRGLPPARLHLVTTVVALSAAAALERVGGVRAGLKWPNDLLVEERKLAGVLAEALDVGAGTVGAVVVGIGINVSAAPPGAVSLDDAAGRAVGRADVLVALLEELEDRYGRWDAVAAEYRRVCVTLGRRVRVEVAPGSSRTGTAVGIDDDGRLVVAEEATGATVSFSAGDVVHVRPAAPDRFPGGGRS
jgi:BirA family biotin operon repressor/biotin-[acetyl-CoA-carboxylase] ligase